MDEEERMVVPDVYINIRENDNDQQSRRNESKEERSGKVGEIELEHGYDDGYNEEVVEMYDDDEAQPQETQTMTDNQFIITIIIPVF